MQQLAGANTSGLWCSSSWSMAPGNQTRTQKDGAVQAGYMMIIDDDDDDAGGGDDDDDDILWSEAQVAVLLSMCVSGGTDCGLCVTVTRRSASSCSWLQTCRRTRRLNDGRVNRSKLSSFLQASLSLTRKDFPSCHALIRMSFASFSRYVGWTALP